MPIKSQKVEKIATTQLADESLQVLNEMLNIIVCRTKLINPEEGKVLWWISHVVDFVYDGPDLKYFGLGKQLKISKLADTLYSTMKDVIVFAMSDIAKESEHDYKFIVPKHTSYVGSIIKVPCLVWNWQLESGIGCHCKQQQLPAIRRFTL